MSASPLSQKSHACSQSLPSKPHPIILQCNELLARLVASDTPSSSSLLNHKLSGLQELHNCIEKLIQLPLTQEALVQECQEKWVDDILDGSLRLLDACTAATDALLHMKECVRELQSIMRRRKGGESEVTAEVKKFLTSRKVARKAILKALGNSKGIVHKGPSSMNNKDLQMVALVRLSKDVEVVSLSVFESLLNFVSGSTQSRPGSWRLVSKLVRPKRVACRQEVDENEFSKVDTALQSFVFHMTRKPESVGNLQNQLQKLESRIQEVEEGLESLFRRLIKIRVAILNILNH